VPYRSLYYYYYYYTYVCIVVAVIIIIYRCSYLEDTRTDFYVNTMAVILNNVLRHFRLLNNIAR